MGRLLEWTEHEGMVHTYSAKAAAIVYPYKEGFHWEVFIGDACTWHGQCETKESAINYVEGNFIGRCLRDDLALELRSAG